VLAKSMSEVLLGFDDTWPTGGGGGFFLGYLGKLKALRMNFRFLHVSPTSVTALPRMGLSAPTKGLRGSVWPQCGNSGPESAQEKRRGAVLGGTSVDPILRQDPGRDFQFCTASNRDIQAQYEMGRQLLFEQGPV